MNKNSDFAALIGLADHASSSDAFHDETVKLVPQSGYGIVPGSVSFSDDGSGLWNSDGDDRWIGVGLAADSNVSITGQLHPLDSGGTGSGGTLPSFDVKTAVVDLRVNWLSEEREVPDYDTNPNALPNVLITAGTDVVAASVTTTNIPAGGEIVVGNADPEAAWFQFSFTDDGPWAPSLTLPATGGDFFVSAVASATTCVGQIDATYVAGGGGAQQPGSVYDLVVASVCPSTGAPVAILDAYEDDGLVVFDASQSYDPDGDPLEFGWQVNVETLIENGVWRIVEELPEDPDLPRAVDTDSIDVRLRDEMPLVRWKYGDEVPIIVIVSDGGASDDADVMLAFEDNAAPGDAGQAQPFPGWAAWNTGALDKLNVEGKKYNQTDIKYVRDAIAALDGAYKIHGIVIPALLPGSNAPDYNDIGPDRSKDASIHNPNYTYVAYAARVRPAQLARINIRVNLQALKQTIVDEAAELLEDHPPQTSPPITLTAAQRADVANRLANGYIRVVDEFLRTHPGAAPRLGTRNRILVWLGLADKYSHPWCADWANYVDDEMSKKLLDNGDPKLSKVLVVRPAQNLTPGEHNWVVVYPFGCVDPDVVSYPGQGVNISNNDAVKDCLLHLDPWKRILPDASREHKIQYLGIASDTKN